jgi:hypothetical protein
VQSAVLGAGAFLKCEKAALVSRDGLLSEPEIFPELPNQPPPSILDAEPSGTLGGLDDRARIHGRPVRHIHARQGCEAQTKMQHG